MIRLVIHGATGRMGRRIDACAEDDQRFAVVARIASETPPDDAHRAARGGDVLIDFSSDAGAQRAAELAAEHALALLVGTTALSRQTIEKIEGYAQLQPVMIAPNTSRGVAIMNHLIACVAETIGRDAHVDLIESHHVHKRDAPSGTALRLARTLRERGVNLPDERIHAIRAGDLIGEHSVQFAASGEILKIFHRATSRDVFARGALDAAEWLSNQLPGLYTIEQSLGLAGTGEQGAD